jgi:hypothetical protein
MAGESAEAYLTRIEAERAAAFLQCVTLRARVAELEAALRSTVRAWDALPDGSKGHMRPEIDIARAALKETVPPEDIRHIANEIAPTLGKLIADFMDEPDYQKKTDANIALGEYLWDNKISLLRLAEYVSWRSEMRP